MNGSPQTALPGWVPDAARHYLTHTEAGITIRDLARAAGCHASTVMRQIRRQELRRDDPLVDGALSALARACFPKDRAFPCPDDRAQILIDAEQLGAELLRVLPRLSEAGAVLAVAEDMERAIVVRDGEGADSMRTAVVDVPVVQIMALNDWIACTRAGRISRYRVTASGRALLSRLLAERESRASREGETGPDPARDPYRRASALWDRCSEHASSRRRLRPAVTESPLAALARRKDRDGLPFLSDELVRAGERLREDFELAQMGPRITQNWERFLSGGGRGGFVPESNVCDAPARARARVARALAELGPGLSDVVLRCCCYLDGLETAEKRMGWSARSGKIVLRIALQRLVRHYGGGYEPSRMIG
ncbi:DUF6456 domain-containing protein [Pontibaca methylaminivorans]|uniref:DUF6456 domain-containing protein n=1 Tax=Pontibaca methylaminivorans TaxID=515897 RepID=A0A1R3W8B6_9RHOB|nr:DUF6456 domain-containing protein [Pontibaca methylaminivorans]SIT73956.1 hypothetical protein SAMN05421849_0072 [Pontibaca methylaminivorans]